MEDGHKILDPMMSGRHSGEDCWGYYAVFDGHGGREETQYCETKMHEVVVAELRGGKDPREALIESFKKVDAQLAILGAWNSGCTATVTLLQRRQGGGSRLFVANVGDSRAVLVSSGSGGTACQRLSTDHRANDASEARRVSDEGGFVRHGRVGGQLSVSRSLGDHHLKEAGVSCIPDVCVRDLAPGDQALVIASDGLWDALNDSDAGQVLEGSLASAKAKGQGGPQGIAEWLRESCAKDFVNYAKEHGTRDNILAVVVFL
jgi:serine/threonine protein phosphatase PrpC